MIKKIIGNSFVILLNAWIGFSVIEAIVEHCAETYDYSWFNIFSLLF